MSEDNRIEDQGPVKKRKGPKPIPDGQPMSAWTRWSRRKAAGLTRTNVRHTFNTSFFEVWSSELAWLLGLIWSDGNLIRDGNLIDIASKDLCLLQTVATLIELYDGISLHNRGRHWNLKFCDKKVADILRRIGLTPKKSLDANWPDVPHEYFGDFLRGLIDGDGWVKLRSYRKTQQVPDLNAGLCGAAQKVLFGVLNGLDEHGIEHSVSWQGSVWKITIARDESLRALYQLLYGKGDVPCLARKREPFDWWMVTPRPKRRSKKS